MTASQPSESERKRRLFKVKLGFTLLVSVLLIGLAAALEWCYVFLPPPLRLASKDFFVKPYVQFGERPDGSGAEIIWFSNEDGTKSDWKFEAPAVPAASPADSKKNPLDDASVAKTTPASSGIIDIKGLPKFRIFTAPVMLPRNGREQQYYVLKNGRVIFQSVIHSITASPSRFRFVVEGDVASGGDGEKQIAAAIYKAKPNLVVLAGDIVYWFGRTVEYMGRLFPVYNADPASLDGSALLRSTLFLAAAGNHDTSYGGRLDVRDLDMFPDGLAYFFFWKQPLNGPALTAGGANTPVARGSAERCKMFREAAGDAYPRQTNCSFDIANSHWLLLDGNPYMDWTNKDLLAWVDKDLATSSSTWKFVVFHQPPFNSDSSHQDEQRMRLLCGSFQRGHVDVVFSGHVHQYQRTYPLMFMAKPDAGGHWVSPNGNVNGDFVLDHKYDGVTDKHPDGVIYMITGGGGAPLSPSGVASTRAQWHPFTATMNTEYSFTQCDVDGKRLIVRQINARGHEVDHFEIDKN